VPVSALRYYDELGLLKPAQVDPVSGYRYYAADQLPRLNRLLALKDMGLSLEQIARLLDDDLTPEQIRGMLKIKQVELQQQLEEGHIRLGRIETWLEQFEQENKMADYDVIIKKVEPLQVAEARGIAPTMEKIELTLDHLFDEVYSYLTQQGAKGLMPGITVYYDKEMTDTDVNVGAALAYEGSTVADGERVKIIEFPAVEKTASVVHHGSFATMHRAYEAVFKWIEANGYQVTGPMRELNLEYERGGDQSKYVTEIQIPVEKA
jgi:effector-binding domain-containing protein